MKKEKLLLATSSGFLLIDVNEIMYCSAEGNYTMIHSLNRKPRLISKHLKAIESRLPSEIFFRCHRSWIVNLNYIKEMCKNPHCILILDNDEKIKISEQNVPKFKRAIEKFYLLDFNAKSQQPTQTTPFSSLKTKR